MIQGGILVSRISKWVPIPLPTPAVGILVAEKVAGLPGLNFPERNR